jgi:tRNA(His) guanylyltransferase
MPDSLGDRQKQYERAFQHVLPNRMPVIIRVDGRAFHTLTSGSPKPWDFDFIDAMDWTAMALCDEIQGAELAYVQSDEISVLVMGYKTLQSQPWFGNELPKMLSASAAIASVHFSKAFCRLATFDSRAFVVPEDDVCNYFIWRQKDWERNSLNMLCGVHYSHSEMHGKTNADRHEMLHAKGVNWNDLPTRLKRGRVIRKSGLRDGAGMKWYVDEEIPVFTQDRQYIERYLAHE